MIETLLGIIIIIFAITIVVYGAFRGRVYFVLDEAREIIEEYKTRCTGANRFVLNETVLRELFPGYHHLVLRTVWKQLVAEKAIDKDPLDQEWCIR